MTGQKVAAERKLSAKPSDSLCAKTVLCSRKVLEHLSRLWSKVVIIDNEKLFDGQILDLVTQRRLLLIERSQLTPPLNFNRKPSMIYMINE